MEEHSEFLEEDDLLVAGEVPRQRWTGFLELFSINFESWIVDVEWPGSDSSSDLYDADLIDDLGEYSLDGIESDLESDNDRVLIYLSNNRRIVLDKPERIELVEADERTDEVLEIEASGVTCRLHLRFPEAEERRLPSDRFGQPSEDSGLPTGDEPAVEDELSIVGGLPF